jgi:Arc/MetJ-type ribon-helix-helix transcriptional regulator
MKQVIVEVDDETAAKLESVASGKSRKRSEFIRAAVRRALWELEERKTREAYLREPDSAVDVYIEPAVWEARPKTRRRKSG